MKKLYCNVNNILKIDNINIVDKSTYDTQFKSMYDNLIKLDLNPISMDIPIRTTFDDDFVTFGKVYIQFKDFDDCYHSYNILNKVFKMIADDTPYIFFFNSKFGFYGHTPKMERVQDAFSFAVGLNTWWITK